MIEVSVYKGFTHTDIGSKCNKKKERKLRMFNKLFEAIGLQVYTRNFLTEYHDSQGQSYHNVLQVIVPFKINDDEIRDHVREKLEKDGNSMYALVEVFGDYTPNQLMKMFDKPPMANMVKVLHFDYKKSLI